MPTASRRARRGIGQGRCGGSLASVARGSRCSVLILHRLAGDGVVAGSRTVNRLSDDDLVAIAKAVRELLGWPVLARSVRRIALHGSARLECNTHGAGRPMP
jgi:hypothetical protein